MFKLKNINFYYDKKFPILKDIDLHLKKGEIHILMGENGSGKSTLLMLLKGINRAVSGEIFFQGERIRNILRDAGFVFQDPDIQIIGPDVLTDLQFGPLNLGWEEEKIHRGVAEAMKLCGITHLREKNPYSLSYGEKRRVAIAGVLAMEPEVLILDEPTTWLDPFHQESLKKLLLDLKKRGKTVILSTHDLSFASELDGEYIFLKDGKIAAQGTDELLKNMELLRECRLYYGRKNEKT